MVGATCGHILSAVTRRRAPTPSISRYIPIGARLRSGWQSEIADRAPLTRAEQRADSRPPAASRPSVRYLRSLRIEAHLSQLQAVVDVLLEEPLETRVEEAAGRAATRGHRRGIG